MLDSNIYPNTIPPFMAEMRKAQLQQSVSLKGTRVNDADTEQAISDAIEANGNLAHLVGLQPEEMRQMLETLNKLCRRHGIDPAQSMPLKDALSQAGAILLNELSDNRRTFTVANQHLISITVCYGAIGDSLKRDFPNATATQLNAAARFFPANPQRFLQEQLDKSRSETYPVEFAGTDEERAGHFLNWMRSLKAIHIPSQPRTTIMPKARAAILNAVHINYPLIVASGISENTASLLMEQFEAFCHCRNYAVSDALWPGVGHALLRELFTNRSALHMPAHDLISVTVSHGAVGPKLSQSFPTATQGELHAAVTIGHANPEAFLSTRTKSATHVASDNHGSAEQFIAAARAQQHTQATPLGGATGLAAGTLSAIASDAATPAKITNLPCSNVDLEQMTIRFEEMCRRNGFVVSRPQRPAIMRQLVHELIDNMEILDLPASKLLSVTAYHGAVASQLRDQFPALPKYTWQYAVMRHPSNPVHYLQDLTRRVETLIADSKWRNINDNNHNLVIKAAMHSVPDTFLSRYRESRPHAGSGRNRGE